MISQEYLRFLNICHARQGKHIDRSGAGFMERGGAGRGGGARGQHVVDQQDGAAGDLRGSMPADRDRALERGFPVVLV